MTPPSIQPPRPDHLILASTSPRRQQFLEQLGLPFTTIAPGAATGCSEIDESPLPGELPAAMVQRLSQDKAQAVLHILPTLFPSLDQYTHPVVIAADTAVVIDDVILGKPDDPTEAIAMLQHLREKPHRVLSGITIALYRVQQPAKITTRLHQSQVWMRPYTDHEIEAYVATGSPLDKAGAYGIQDVDFTPVSRFDGCFASVMGFPLLELATAINEIGLSLPEINPLCQQLTGHLCCAAK